MVFPGVIVKFANFFKERKKKETSVFLYEPKNMAQTNDMQNNEPALILLRSIHLRM